MKGISFIFTLAIFLLLASCSSADENLRAMVPDDALGVVKINLPNVLVKAGIKNGDGEDASLSIPSDLKQVIDESNENIVDEVNILGDVIGSLPSSGIDVNSNCYLFLSQGALNAVALFHLEDNAKAQEMVSRIAGGKMKEMSGVTFVSHLDYVFAIDDDVLLIARKNNATDDKASAEAKNILNKSKSSLFENADIAKAIDVENCDIAAYVDAKGLPLLLDDSHFSTSVGDFSPLDFIAESGIKAMTATVNFNDTHRGEEKVEIVTDFICSNSSVYSLFYDRVVATSTGGGAIETLEAVPGDFDTYFTSRINGEELMKMPGVAKLLQDLPVNGLDCGKILSSLNGDLVWGSQRFDDGDIVFGVAVESSSAHAVVDEIVNFATLHGQAPIFNAGGEYQYDTSDGTKALVMNKRNDVVYLRYVNFVPNSTADQWPALVGAMKTSTVAFFKIVKIQDKQQGHLCWGLRNKTHGEGFYYTLDENENIATATLKSLCWKEPQAASDDEIGLSDF